MIGRSLCSIWFLFPVTVYKVHLLHVCWHYLYFLNVWCSKFLKITINFVFVFKKMLMLKKVLIWDCSNCLKMSTLSKKSRLTGLWVECHRWTEGSTNWCIQCTLTLWECLKIIVLKHDMFFVAYHRSIYLPVLVWISPQDGSLKQDKLREYCSTFVKY